MDTIREFFSYLGCWFVAVILVAALLYAVYAGRKSG